MPTIGEVVNVRPCSPSMASARPSSGVPHPYAYHVLNVPSRIPSTNERLLLEWKEVFEAGLAAKDSIS